MILGAPIAKGNTADIYLYNNKIVKVFNDYLPDSEAFYEASKQEYAFSCGLSVPKVYSVTKIGGKQAIIMEYIEGKTLADLYFENKEHAEYYLDISVDVQLKIHSIIPETIEPMVKKLHHQIEGAPILAKRQKSYLIEKLDSMIFETRLCHGDFHLFNLIMTDNKISIKDWVDSSAGDIHADIYRTYLLYSQLSLELAEMYLRLYCEKSGLLKSDVFQWAPIIAGARLFESVETESKDRLMAIINKYCP